MGPPNRPKWYLWKSPPPQLFIQLRECCNSLDCELHIGIGLESHGIYVIFGIVTDLKSRFGGFVNTTGSLSLESAVNSVVFTLSRYITIVKNRINNKLPLFRPDGIPKLPIDHFEYYLHPQNFKKVSWILETGKALPWNQKYDTIEVDKLDLGLEFPIPCVVAYAHSDQLQTYFSGPTSIEKLNYSYQQIFSNLNLDIHPLP